MAANSTLDDIVKDLREVVQKWRDKHSEFGCAVGEMVGALEMVKLEVVQESMEEYDDE